MPNVVASLNIQHCSRSAPGAVAAFLRDHGVTVAALQEVDRGTVRSGTENQPALIASAANLPHSCYCPTLNLALNPLSAQAQMRYLSEAVPAGEYCIFAGDLNGQNPPPGFMEGDSSPTCPSQRPRVRLDHVAVSPGFPHRVRWSTVCRPDITDHCMVIACVNGQ
jgi:endonuclease/exonuclease/phosphatase family metal-dependent hydrolase